MLGDIASIATLILFIIYFIGRIITITIEKNIRLESIDTFEFEEQIPKNIKIVDEFRENENYKEILILTPKVNYYNWIKVYSCKYDEKTNRIKKGKELYKTGIINNNTSFRFDTIISHGIPRYIIEFERNNFIKGDIEVVYNGKNGVQEELIKYHHSVKSIIYILFK